MPIWLHSSRHDILMPLTNCCRLASISFRLRLICSISARVANPFANADAATRSTESISVSAAFTVASFSFRPTTR